MIHHTPRYKKSDLEMALSYLDMYIGQLVSQIVYEVDEYNRVLLKRSVKHLTAAYVEMERYSTDG